MNKKSLFLVSFLLIAMLTACNMPSGETSSIADAARQTQQARQVNNNAQPQPTQQQQNANNAQPEPAVQPTQQSTQPVAQPTQQNLQPTTALVVQDTPVPTQVPPTATQPPPPTTVSIATKSGYVELRDWYVTEDLADLDFDGVPQLGYIAATSDYPNHGLGENVAQGNITNMMLVTTATYDTCLAINSWDTSVAPVSAGQTYCFVADNNNGTSYGYFHIDKIENQGSEMDNWVIGISYTVWIPASPN